MQARVCVVENGQYMEACSLNLLIQCCNYRHFPDDVTGGLP